MPTILTSSQQTFVDITDQRKLSAYITSNRLIRNTYCIRYMTSVILINSSYI